MRNFCKITMRKNRGWRGLAQARILNEKYEITMSQIFSFSQDMWEDLMKGYIVLADEDNYYVIEFDNLKDLPKPTQQRSVLIKDFTGNILNVNKYSKTSWTTVKGYDYKAINDYIHNKNNHTTSDWNCIGIRVNPYI